MIGIELEGIMVEVYRLLSLSILMKITSLIIYHNTSLWILSRVSLRELLVQFQPGQTEVILPGNILVWIVYIDSCQIHNHIDLRKQCRTCQYLNLLTLAILTGLMNFTRSTAPGLITSLYRYTSPLAVSLLNI